MNGSTYNFIMDTDCYKLGSHWKMYPKNLDFITSYGECRSGSLYPELVFAGLRPLIHKITGTVITAEKVEEAFSYFNEEQKDQFNYDGWMYIANELGGKLPLEIKALREGTIIPKSQAMMQITNTVKGFAWLVGDSETMISRVWQGIGTATKSNAIRTLFKKYYNLTSDQGEKHFMLNYMLQDFGSRSATSFEHSAMYGVMHKLIFEGTDTVYAAKYAVDHYNADPATIISFVPASEHSVMTINGREGEEEVFKRLLETFPTGLLSIVDDSYDDNNFTTVFATKYKDVILARDGKVVFRPDSGDPVETVLRQLNNLEGVFGSTKNNLGFKILNPKVGILWGDGIDIDGISNILVAMTEFGWSIENIVFGIGSALCQKHNRDTIAWAFKACAALFTGYYTLCETPDRGPIRLEYIEFAKWSDVYKDPVNAGDTSDFTKASKRGIQKVIFLETGEYKTVRADNVTYAGYDDQLRIVLRDGKDFYDELDDWDAVVARVRS